jgi:predicted kinase
MPIRIIDGNPADSNAGRPLIESDALRLLQREMQRYCDQQVDGRSFLISGHRGAGKTTLVEGALQRILASVSQTDVRERLSQRRGEAQTLRPLLVRLQGPNLLPPTEEDTLATAPDPQSTAPADASGKPGAGQKPGPNQPEKPGAASSAAPGPMETVLIQITLGLHRALVDAFADAYRKRLQGWSGELARMHGQLERNSAVGSVYRRAMRDLELAAQLELDLDENPGKARLRERLQRARSTQLSV